MSQVTFQIIVFNGEHFLEPALKSLLKFGRVVAVEGPVKYWQDRGFKTSTDCTNEILHAYLPATHIAHGQFAEKDEMMNVGAAMISSDTTHVWQVDADEVWDTPTLTAILAELDAWDAVSFKPRTFYGGFERCMGGFEERFEWMRVQRWHKGAQWETHRPPTVLAPDGAPYKSKRHLHSEMTAARGLRFFHYSYVYPSQVKAKTDYYTSWNAGVIRDYFARVYKPWVLGDAKEQRTIENDYDGVHEWLPTRRGDARTYPFAGEHPRHIDHALVPLKRRLAMELAELRQGRI